MDHSYPWVLRHYLIDEYFDLKQKVTNQKKKLDEISNKFKEKGVGQVLGKTYLLKAPNGKPMFFTFKGIRNNNSMLEYGFLEYGSIFSNLNVKTWYIAVTDFTSTKRVKTADKAVSTEYAFKMFKDLGIPLGNRLPSNTEDILKNDGEVKYTVL